MAYPPEYERTFSFSDYEVTHPGEPKPGVSLDAEFDDVSTALTATQDNLALIQRADGQLANDSVGEDQLQADVFDGLVDGITADAEAAADAAAASATVAAGHASDAALSAGGASVSEDQAAGHAANAGASQTIAQDAANQAELSAQEAAVSANEAASAANLATGAVADVESEVELAYRWAEYLAAPVMPAPDGYPEAVDDGMWSAKWWALKARDYSQTSQVDFGTSSAPDIGDAYEDWGGVLPPGNVIASWNGDEYWLIDRTNPGDPASWLKLTGDTGPVGPANSLAIGTVTTLPPGSAATATITGTPPSQTLSLGIPQGATGSGGAGAGGTPTALVGLTPIVGVSLELIRADGAPALNQAIAPNWTGNHTWTDSTLTIRAVAAASQSADLFFDGRLAPVNQRLWRWRVNQTGDVQLTALTDDLSAGNRALTITRTLTAIGNLSFGNATNNPTYSFLGTGLATFSGSVFASRDMRVYGAVRATGWHDGSNVGTASGAGVEIGYSTDLARVYAYDRTGSVFRPLQVAGLTLALDSTAGNINMTASGGGAITFTSTTLTHNGNVIPHVGSSPTWTAQHIFTSISPGGGAVQIKNVLPQLMFYEDDAAVDNRVWMIEARSERFNIGLYNDAFSAATAFLTVDRTGTTVDTIAFTAPLSTFSGAVTAAGVRAGGTGSVTAPLISAAGSSTGNALEWGHSNSSGYRHTLGHSTNSGQGFIAFHAEHGTAANTFRTRGVLGSVIFTDAAGAVRFGRLTAASADNLSPTLDLTWSANGGWTFAAPVVVGNSAGPQPLIVTGPAATNRDIYFSTGAVSRWVFRVNGTTESGSNAGSDFNLIALSDSGSLVGTPLTISRATMAATWTGPHTFSPASGNAVTINALTGSIGLLINGAANGWAQYVAGNVATGQSYGLIVAAGTNASDKGFQVRNQASSADYLIVRGDGQVQIADGTAAIPAQAFIGEPGTGFYRPGGSIIGVSNAGVNSYQFSTASFAVLGGRALQLNNAANNAAGVISNSGASGTSVLSFVTDSVTRLTIASGGVTIATPLTVTGLITGTTTTQPTATNDTTLASTAFVHNAITGTGRTWHSMTFTSGSVQTNTTGQDMPLVTISSVSPGGTVSTVVNSDLLGINSTSGSASVHVSNMVIVPPGGTWSVNWSGTVNSILVWGYY